MARPERSVIQHNVGLYVALCLIYARNYWI